jgi:methylmalonyl-CoA/ethylmalonyl-CoA epimerase
LQRVRIAVVTLRGGHQIELIEPANRESPISRFLRQKRGGLYHCCYAVDDLAKAMRQFVDKGCVLISGPAPACALDNRKVVFLFTPHHDVIELVEERRPL